MPLTLPASIRTGARRSDQDHAPHEQNLPAHDTAAPHSRADDCRGPRAPYQALIACSVKTLARRGVLSLLDFHQDRFNERFQGEGAPDWAVQDGGLPNLKLGFPTNYLLSPAVQHAFDQFWANAPGPGGVGLQDRFASAWAHVAAQFRR